MKVRLGLIIQLLFISFFIGCTPTSNVPVTQTSYQTPTSLSPAQSQREYYNKGPGAETAGEAELMALFLSQELRAPQQLQDQIFDDLHLIRSTFGDEIPRIKEICFWWQYSTKSIYVVIGEATHRTDYKYSIEQLNSELMGSIITGKLTRVTFNNNYHPRRLTELYIDAA
jgi:hypothetical protein